MDIFGSVTSAVGGIIGAAGAQSQAASQSAALKMQGRAAVEAANQEANTYKRQQMAERAKGVAARAASGVTMEGSPAMVDENIVQEIALNEARIRHGGKAEQIRLGNEAKNVRKSAKIQAFTQLLSAGQTSASLLAPRFGGSYKS